MNIEEKDTVEEFLLTVESIEKAIVNLFAYHGVHDGIARGEYDKNTFAKAKELLKQTKHKSLQDIKIITDKARKIRGEIMELLRKKSTPLGKQIAIFLKDKNKALEDLIVRKTHQLFAPHITTKSNQLSAQQKIEIRKIFEQLAPDKKKIVYRAIIKSSGRPNRYLSPLMRGYKYLGGILLPASIALSAFQIYYANDRLKRALYEVDILMSSIIGGLLGGTLATSVCMGAMPVVVPICTAVGTVVGGLGATMWVDLRHDLE